MVTKHQSTGMTGLYLVAAELSTRGFIVSPTSRSAQAADLLVTDGGCQRAFAVQVKTNARTFGAWLVNAMTSKLVSDNLVYALVNLTKKGPEFFLAPSAFVAANLKHEPPSNTRRAHWYAIERNRVLQFQNNWGIFADGNVIDPAWEIYKSSPIMPRKT